MNILPKELETTSQLPPSTPQQRVTPPTVLLPATFAILPPQSTAFSAALAATAASNSGTSVIVAATASGQSMSMSVPLLGHSLASAGSPNVVSAVGRATASVGASSHTSNPSMIFGPPSMHSAIDISGVDGSCSSIPCVKGTNAFQNDGNSPVSDVARSGSHAAVSSSGDAGKDSVLNRKTRLRSNGNDDKLSILLPSSCALVSHSTTLSATSLSNAGGGVSTTAAAAAVNASPSSSLALQLQHPQQQLLHHDPISDSPSEAGHRRSTTAIMTEEEDELMLPFTPASSLHSTATRRSVSAFDSKGYTVPRKSSCLQSRAHSFNCRGGSVFLEQQQQHQQQQRPASAGTTIDLHLRSPVAFGHAGDIDLQRQRQGNPRITAVHTDAAVPELNTPCSVLSANSTPPAIGRSHVSAGTPVTFYPSWAVDGVCAFCPITSLVETTSHEEHSGGRASNSPSSHQQQQHHPQQQCTQSTGVAARTNHTRTHVSLHEGPVMMTAATKTPPTATTPVSPNAGWHTPSSPLYTTPALYVQTGSPVPPAVAAAAASSFASSPTCDCRRGESSGSGRTPLMIESREDLSSSLYATSRAPTPPSGGGGGGAGLATNNAVMMVTAAAGVRATPGACGVPPLRHTAGIQINATNPTNSSNMNCGSLGAMDRLSEFSAHTQQYQQQHTLLKDGITSYSTHHHPTFGTTTTTTNLSTSAFPGNLTFLPIEVQSASTVVSPFFGHMSSSSSSGNNNASAAAAPSPGNTAHSTTCTPSRISTVSQDRSDGSNSCYHGTNGLVALNDHTSQEQQQYPAQIPVKPHLARPMSSPSCGLEVSSSTSNNGGGVGFPLSAATSTGAHATWPLCAAPGVVTAILAAPEVSWTSSFGASTATAAASAMAAENAAVTSRSSSNERLEDNSRVAGSADTHSPGTSLSLVRATSPAPWLQRVGTNNSSSSGGKKKKLAQFPSANNDSNTSGCQVGTVRVEEGLFNRGAFGHAIGGNYHAYSAALPAFNSTLQFQLSCTPVPLEDTESECVICLEGHPTQAEHDALIMSDRARDGRSTSEVMADLGGGVKPGSQLLMMPCKHCCHQNCLQRWLIQSTYCPICRRDLTQDATLLS